MPDKPVKLPENQDAESIRDGQYQLTISDDKLSVYIQIIQLPLMSGQKITLKQITDHLKEKKINFGINNSVIEDIIKIANQGYRPINNSDGTICALIDDDETPNDNTSDKTDQTLCIATGKPPENGQDATITWIIGQAVYEDYIAIPDELIAIYHPPQNGQPGINVFGETVSAHNGIDQTPKPDEGIKSIDSHDGLEYRARWYGHCAATESSIAIKSPAYITDDKMHATLDFSLPGKADTSLSLDHILCSLNELNITHGINKDVITATLASLAEELTTITGIEVATGQYASAGRDAKIIWAAELDNASPATYTVRPGYVIARILPAKHCTLGRDIFGNSVSCINGSAISFMIDDHISVDSEKNEYSAKVAGILSISEDTDEIQCSIDPHLTVSDDKMTAWLDIYPHPVDGGKLTTEEIRMTLSTLGIQYGIKNNEITEALKSSVPQSIKHIIVAEGRPPINGVDAHVHYNLEKQVVGKKLKNGRIDFHEHNYPWNIAKGETVGYLFAAKPRQDGINILGDTINATEPKINNIELEGAHIEKNNRIIADIDGALIVSGNQVSVTDLFVIDGDINQKTGNINCTNDVHVKGHVEPGFKLKSGKSAIIDNNVENAVISCGSSIVIKGGIRGHMSEVYTPGDITAGFIENAEVYVNGDIYVAESIINSKVSSNGNITIGSKNAKHSAVIGGRITAHKCIEVYTLGTPSFHRTIISVGFTQETKQLQRDLRKKIAIMNHELLQLDQLDAYYRHHTEHEARHIMAKTQATRTVINQEIIPLKLKLQQILEDLRESENAKVIIHKRVYPGVTIKINDYMFEVDREMNSGAFILLDGNIIFTPR